MKKKKQPKFNKDKEPVENGDGLEEYISDQPNFRQGERKQKVKRKM